jgi:hypothetical protein
MKLNEVLENDIRMLAKVLTMLQGSEYNLSGKDICAAADAIRWLQDVAKQFAETYSAPKTSVQPAVAETKPATAVPSEPEMPLPGMGDVKIKSYSPGKLGKK